MAADEPGRAEALIELYSAVADVLNNGSSVPCMSDPGLWLSESTADQEAAGWRCMACPAITDCRAYVLTHPEPVGVWAAMTAAQRKKTKRAADRQTFPGDAA
jgi:hypothetical protein